MKLTRTIVKHSKKCFMKNKENPWSGLLTGAPSFYGNYAARKIIDGNHKWFTVVCNDPNCKAVRAIHIKAFQDLAGLDIEVDRIDYRKNQLKKP